MEQEKNKREVVNEREVVIMAIKEKYRKTPFTSPSVWDENIHAFLTGQHIVPGDPSTDNNLTVDEMTGKKALTNEKAKKFPFVINPETAYAIIHGRRLNLNTKEDGTPVFYPDWAFYNWLKYIPEVAQSEKDIIPTKHILYLLDKEQEAKVKIDKRKQFFKAMKLIDSLSFAELADVALLLNYYVPGFNVNVQTLSKTMLEEKIGEACELHSEHIMKYSEDGAKEDLFYLRLYSTGIISKRENAFYDGSQYLGNTLSDLKMFINKKENDSYKSKWTRLLRDKMGDSINVYIKKSDDKKEENTSQSVLDTYTRKVQDFRAFIEEKNYDDAMSVYRSAIIVMRDGKENENMKSELATLKKELNK
jgi:hypothetical protein